MEKEKLPIIYFSYFGTAPPSYYGIRYQYVPGTGTLEWPPPGDRVPAERSEKFWRSAFYNLQDVSRPGDPLFRWLWVRKPIAKIGYSIFVYDLTDDREGLKKLEETYAKAGISLMHDPLGLHFGSVATQRDDFNERRSKSEHDRNAQFAVAYDIELPGMGMDKRVPK